MGQQTRYIFLLRYILPFVDLLMINVIYYIAAKMAEIYSHVPWVDNNHNHIIVCNLIWLICSSYLNLYNVLGDRKMEKVYRATWKSIVLHIILYILYLVLHKEGHFSLKFVSWFYPLLGIGFIINRFIGTTMHHKAIQRFRLARRVAIIGSNSTSKKLIDHFKQEPNVLFYGAIGDDEIAYFDQERLMSTGITQRLAKAAGAGVTDLYVTVMPNRLLEVSALVEEADKQGLRLKFIPDFGTHLFSDYDTNYLGDKFPIITTRKEPLEEIDARFKKRLFDLVFSGMVAIFVLWWLIPIIALLIKLDSKGPVFFLQNRTGRNNKPFKVIKFRTMKVLEEDDKFIQAKKGDERITRIGEFLRKTSLDEFPQFINVLKGEMSVVGPRPHPLLLNIQFHEIINKYMVRHFVKPGITGWAQVHGFRGETKDLEDMENRIKYDIYYLENWTAMFDVRIIFMTIINMFRGEDNAY